MQQVRKIGVLTSGGDSPGMNAAIRAVVRTAIYYEMEVFGICRGYQGMTEGDIRPLKATDVSNIIQRGGTILKTARSEDFRTEEGMKRAFEQLQQYGIDALVLIGGDGTFRGASAFFERYKVPAIGLPGTIDKDLAGTDTTIGFDTAVNTAIEAIDKIRDTAEAHDRTFIVEVMGRDAGYIALHSGIACGAEDILIPEIPTHVEGVLGRIAYEKGRKKNVYLIVAAEGDDFGGASELAELIIQRFPDTKVRTAILGHIQRGGRPTCADRVLASRLGYGAVMALREGKANVMAGLIHDKIVFTPFEAVVKRNAIINEDMEDMIRVLAI